MHAVAVSVAANIKGRIIQMGNSGIEGEGVNVGERESVDVSDGVSEGLGEGVGGDVTEKETVSMTVPT